MSPLFTVIIPTYNREALVDETLLSIEQQSFKDFETIVVDDGFLDSTCEMVERYDWVRLYRQTNSGPGTARNCAAQHAKGKYLAFLDSDDLWFPWTLKTYAEVIQRHPKVAFIAGSPFRFNQVGSIRSCAPQALETAEFGCYLDGYQNWRWFGVSSFVIDRSSFSELGGFRTGRVNGEDAELALRLGLSPFTQVISPFTFAYREHDSNITNNLARTYEGTIDLLDGEADGRFPGGIERKFQRREIITRQARPLSINLARSGRLSDAWRLYRRTFASHVCIRRFRFLAYFPILMAAYYLRHTLKKSN